ncbi:MAG: zinc metalloprotease [Saprospiraceae bacterium]
MKRMLLVVCLAYLVIQLPSCKKDLLLDQTLNKVLEINPAESTTRISRCNTDRRMDLLYQSHPGYRSEILEGRQQEMLHLEDRSPNELALLTIPVHVIVVHRSNHALGTQTNISDQRITSQIAALNLDFLRKNADAVNTPSVFSASGGQIQFCFANVDPNGQATNGITRYATNQNFDNNEIAIKKATRWDPKRYLNVWVAPDIEGLGYAYLPTPNSLPSPDEDGVVILTEAFGGPNTGAAAPFNLGRSLTHEVGHYLGLDHIWGDGCKVDDGISDTPNQAQENYDCPNHPSPSCNNNGDMFMNYMDYVDDDCMNAFTTGQVTYMRAILNSSRAQLITTGRTSCSGGTPPPAQPTCNDGIKNGDETGIDCGGSCKPCEVAASGVDAGLTSLTYAISGSQACSPAVNFKVVLNNYGSTALNSVVIELTGNGSQLLTFTWKGQLAAKGKTTIGLPAVNLSGGQQKITATSKNPNGKADANSNNDQTSTSLNVPGGSQLTLVIKPDDYGADISWKIRDSQGKVVAKGSGYPDYNRNQINESICLPAGCYKLTMYDSYGDGICCDYGKGWYELRDANGKIILDSDGYYGYRETQSFCLDSKNRISVQGVDRDARTVNTDRRISVNPAKNQ